jgi:hypothetical protein
MTKTTTTPVDSISSSNNNTARATIELETRNGHAKLPELSESPITNPKAIMSLKEQENESNVSLRVHLIRCCIDSVASLSKCQAVPIEQNSHDISEPIISKCAYRSKPSASKPPRKQDP